MAAAATWPTARVFWINQVTKKGGQQRRETGVNVSHCLWESTCLSKHSIYRSCVRQGSACGIITIGDVDFSQSCGSQTLSPWGWFWYSNWHNNSYWPWWAAVKEISISGKTSWNHDTAHKVQVQVFMANPIEMCDWLETPCILVTSTSVYIRIRSLPVIPEVSLHDDWSETLCVTI